MTQQLKNSGYMVVGEGSRPMVIAERRLGLDILLYSGDKVSVFSSRDEAKFAIAHTLAYCRDQGDHSNPYRVLRLVEYVRQAERA